MDKITGTMMDYVNRQVTDLATIQQSFARHDRKTIFADIVQTLFCLMCFMAPLDWAPQRTIAFKGILLLLMGLFSWLGISLHGKHFLPRTNPLTILLLIMLTASAMLTSIFTADHITTLLGSPYFRVGTLGLASLIGIGFIMRQLGGKRLLTTIYLVAVTVAVVSVCYNWLSFSSLVPLSGPVQQADNLAAWLGAAVVIGLWIYRWYPNHHRLVLAGQAILVTAVCLTESRAVIVLIPLLALLGGIYSLRSRKLVKTSIAGLCLLSLSLIPQLHLRSTQINDASYLDQSAAYRLHLQAYAFKAVTHMPPLGFGPGNLQQVLSCTNFVDSDLLKTCAQGFIFDSTHNIYLDRILELGWLGGGIFLLLTILGVVRGLRSTKPELQAAAWGLLLLALYYLTNVTSVDLELLFWVLLFFLLFPNGTTPSSHVRPAAILSRHGYKVLTIIVLVAIFVLSTTQLALSKSAKPASDDIHAKSLPWPKKGQAAVGIAGLGVLAQSSDQSSRPTASTAKILTALAVLTVKPLQIGQSGPMLTINQDDVNTATTMQAQGDSIVPLQAGEQISEHQALEALLLPSAGNVASVLAKWAFGSERNYVLFANGLSSSLGLTGTHIADASGLSAQTVSSPSDLVLLSERAIQNPVLASIVDLPQATLPHNATVKNLNALLGVDGINGIKTGNTGPAGGVYVFSAPATLHGRTVTVVGAIMGESTLAAAQNDALPLLAATGKQLSKISQ